jgi:hypothetical protein
MEGQPLLDCVAEGEALSFILQKTTVDLVDDRRYKLCGFDRSA